MKEYKAIFIDWDDTIGDWSSAALAAQKDIYAKYSLSEFGCTFGEWFSLYHDHNNLLWEQYGRSEISKEYLQRDRFLHPLVTALGGSEVLMQSARFQSLADNMGSDFLQLTNKYFSLMPDAETVIPALAERYPLTVVSNGFQEVQYYKLMHSGLRQHFENVILSEEIGVQKPSVRFFDIALDTANLKRREHNLPPLTTDDILMIGDSYTSDIKGAIAAHIDQLWLCPDSEAMTDDSRPATYKVIGLNKILPLLENCRS